MSKSSLRSTDKNNVITCLSPCVCLTPRGGDMVPVPYMIISKLEWATSTISNVTFGGDEAFTMDSRTTKVEGNEPGTGGGVSSGVNIGWCRPQSHKSNFFIDGKQVIQADCIFEMNCAGPNGPSNIIGKINYTDRK